MRGGARVVRAGVATAVLASGLGFASSLPPAHAGDPTPCGFVAVSDSSTTTRVTLVNDCEWPDCVDGNGPNHYQPPVGAGGVTVEAYVCVSNVA